MVRYFGIAILGMSIGLVAKDSEDFLKLQKNLASQFKNAFGNMDLNRGKLLVAIPESYEQSFKSGLATAKKFVGTDDVERKINFAVVETAWKSIFKGLKHALEHVATNNQYSKNALQEVAINQLSSLKIDKNMIAGYFNSALSQMDTLIEIRDGAEINAGMDKASISKCYGQACKERFKILFLYAEYCIIVLKRMQKILDELENLSGATLPGKRGA